MVPCSVAVERPEVQTPDRSTRKSARKPPGAGRARCGGPPPTYSVSDPSARRDRPQFGRPLNTCTFYAGQAQPVRKSWPWPTRFRGCPGQKDRKRLPAHTRRQLSPQLTGPVVRGEPVLALYRSRHRARVHARDRCRPPPGRIECWPGQAQTAGDAPSPPRPGPRRRAPFEVAGRRTPAAAQGQHHHDHNTDKYSASFRHVGARVRKRPPQEPLQRSSNVAERKTTAHSRPRRMQHHTVDLTSSPEVTISNARWRKAGRRRRCVCLWSLVVGNRL